jgi:hypothetical protein
LKKRPTRRVWAGAGAAPPPNPPPRPASGSHRFPNTLGQVGEQYGPSIAPLARARCPFSPLLIKAIFFRRGSARVARGPVFVFWTRSCFIAFALGIPNGVWPLNRAVGRAYIRKAVPSLVLGACAWWRGGGGGKWQLAIGKSLQVASRLRYLRRPLRRL